MIKCGTSMKSNMNFFLSVILGLLLAGCASQSTVSDSDIVSNTDDLFIVDCLLPGQIRRLGTMATYLTARRAIKTTASDCAIRGGEYVPPSQATYRTALEIWQPKAEAGDPEAQTYVGEIYEKGYGRKPDYEMAALWYKKAAQQGYARAQVSLGYLYEKGLGVNSDKSKAMELYAKSMKDKDFPYAVTISTQDKKYSREIELLKAELKNSEIEKKNLLSRLQAKQDELTIRSQKIEDLQKQIDKIKVRIRDESSLEHDELQRQLSEQETKLLGERNKVSSLAAQYDDDLEALRITLLNTQKRAEQIAQELNKEQTAANALQVKLHEAEARLAAKESELLDQQQSYQQKIQQLQLGIQNLDQDKHTEIELSEKTARQLEQELQREKTRIQKLEKEKLQFKEQLARLEANVQKTAALEKPEIEILDPSFVYTRGVPTVKLRSFVDSREIVGKVNAPSGLLSLSVNDARSVVDDNGVFKASVPVQSDNTSVKVVAVDKQGQKASLDFVLALDFDSTSLTQDTGLISQPQAGLNQFWRKLKFGQYYALVIGNNKYQKVPSLDTPHSDARAVAAVLENKYGFQTEVLLDATRYQILSALNKYRAKLTENDNLLIYYAGHGELDRVNMRGHWLPVDADADNTANWISTVAITDILNAVSSKHILVVSDSCYSGAMTRSSLARLDSGMGWKKKMDWIKAMIKTKSRTVLTSGGLKPVMDGGGGDHSVFAKAFIQTLQNNNDLLEGQAMYQNVSAGIVSIASRFGIEQVPEYAPIRHAGHESGEFFFVPN